MTLLVAASSFLGWFAVHLLSATGVTNVFLRAAVIAVVVTVLWLPQHMKLWRRYKDTGHLFFAA